MEYRILANGQSIPVSNRYRAQRMYAQGQSVDDVVAATGISRLLARQYLYEFKAQQKFYGSIDDHIAVKIPAGLSDEARAALQAYLADLCVPAFLASLK